MPRTRARTPKLKPDSDLAHRLQLHGERSLTDAELLALIGGIDTQHAVSLLQESRGLARLRIALDTVFPDTSIAAARLRASLELSNRMLRAKLPRGKLLDRPAAVAKYLQARYRKPGQEIVGAIYLDNQLRFIEDRELFRGTKARCDVSPEPYLRHALLIRAEGIVAFHTHPGGDATPSEDDVAFTGRLVKACEVVGVMLVDHLILGEAGAWESMRREGFLES